MAQTTIPIVTGEIRTERGSRSARRLRGKGRLPAVLYGHKQENLALTVDHDEIDRLLRHGTHVVELHVGDTVEQALIKDIQHDFGGYGLFHIDFARVAMDETVTVTVALDFHGTPEGSTHGGVVEYHQTDVEVECLPANIPEALRVDIGHLQIGETMHARDLTTPEGVRIVANPEELIVGVPAPRAAAVVAAEEVAAEEAAEPEVIGEKKEEEERAKE
jgi:large subunit ribosomal protein L25